MLIVRVAYSRHTGFRRERFHTITAESQNHRTLEAKIKETAGSNPARRHFKGEYEC